MTPRPTVPAVTEPLYNELSVTQPGDDQRGWPLLIVLGAVGTMFGRLYDVVRDRTEGPGWSLLLDPARCPGWALVWLSQFAGVRRRVEAAATEAEKRALITSPPTFERCSRDGMRAAVAAKLISGDPGNVQVIERAGGNAYALTVRVRASDCPDVAAATAAARTQKPLESLLTLVASDSPLIDEATRLGNSATAVGDTAALGDVT